MITLNLVFQRYGSAYRAQPPIPITPSQRRAMSAIEACRTEALGGQVFTCPSCHTMRYSYHSCRNRHCPTCQRDAGQVWLTTQQSLLLPVPYFLVTFTLPAELRAVARANQRTVYTAMFRASATALQHLASDPRHLGGMLGMLGILQTWTRDLRYHPHIHYLIPAVGLAADGTVVFPPSTDFLVPVRPLAALFRGKFQASLRQTRLYTDVPRAAWDQPWVVDCRPVGTGETALKYLAPYVFRVALSNNRLLAMDNDQITFRYRHSASGENCTSTVAATVFIHRFLEHVLPSGFVKVRYYGLFSVGKRSLLQRIRAQVMLVKGVIHETPSADSLAADRGYLLRCPACGAVMHQHRLLPIHTRSPPARKCTMG